MNTGIATLERDIEKMRENIEHTFENFLGGRKAAADGDYMTEWVPDADATEDSEGFTLQVALPGVKKEDVETEVKENTLVISGRRELPENTRKNLIRREIPLGRFYRAFKIGAPIKPGAVKASMRDGILEIRLPKSEDARPSRIVVE
jgi:HSP20 family protein